VHVTHAVVLQLDAQLLGAIPPKYFPVIQLLQSLAPIPTQLTQGEKHTWQVLSDDLQYVPPLHTLLHSFTLVKAKVTATQAEH
jgi:hypothetical protein